MTETQKLYQRIQGGIEVLDELREEDSLNPYGMGILKAYNIILLDLNHILNEKEV